MVITLVPLVDKAICGFAVGTKTAEAAALPGFATLMTALQQWGDRWIYGEGHEPLLVLDRRSGRRIPRLRILDNEGRPLAGRDMALAPGPGASKRTLARYGAT